GGEQDDRGRRLVDLARLDADQPILDLVDTADTMPPTETVQPFDERDTTERLAVERDRYALAELQHELARLLRRFGRIDRPPVDVTRRRAPRVLEHAGLDRPAPQVLVHAVRALLGGLDRDATLPRVVDLLITRHVHAAAH